MEAGGLKVGEVRFTVFNDPGNDMPWLARVRLVSLSPKARRATWEVVNGGKDPPARYRSRDGFHPHVDPVAAIEEYQRKAAFKTYAWGDRRALDLAVHRIVTAEAMKERVWEGIAAKRERDARLAASSKGHA